jgi:choloylglycine hydrolase
MTNGPSYPHHIENLSHYFSFGGELAIPEGISSMDRFVRASFLLKHACPPNSSPAIVAFVFSLIRHMAVPFGTPFFNANSHPSPTWWTTVVDLSNCTYYYSSQLLPQVIWVDLQQVSWDELDDVYVIDPNDPTVYGAL